MNEEMYIALIGVFLIIFSIIRYMRKKNLLKNGISAKGRVIDLNLEHSGQTNIYYPIVRFKVEDGPWITEKYSDGTNPSSFKKGDEIDFFNCMSCA